MTLEIHFGALAPKLSEQLKEQGLEDKDITKHEKIMESMIMLYLHGYTTDTQNEKMHKRLFSDIKKKVKPINKEV